MYGGDQLRETRERSLPEASVSVEGLWPPVDVVEETERHIVVWGDGTGPGAQSLYRQGRPPVPPQGTEPLEVGPASPGHPPVQEVEGLGLTVALPTQVVVAGGFVVGSVTVPSSVHGHTPSRHRLLDVVVDLR